VADTAVPATPVFAMSLLTISMLRAPLLHAQEKPQASKTAGASLASVIFLVSAPRWRSWQPSAAPMINARQRLVTFGGR